MVRVVIGVSVVGGDGGDRGRYADGWDGGVWYEGDRDDYFDGGDGGSRYDGVGHGWGMEYGHGGWGSTSTMMGPPAEQEGETW